MNFLADLRLRLQTLGPLHFIGAAGSGMRPLAHFAHLSGAVVTGSDSNDRPLVSPFPLERDGSEGSLNAIKDAKTIIYSSAINRDHPELLTAIAQRKTVLHRSEFLSEVTGFFKTISIAGTHGKSTVAALVTHILLRCAKEPSWIIGAPFANGVEAFGLGLSEYLVIEADESDGTFLRYKTNIGLINNIAADHLDFYGDLGKLRATFGDFAKSIQPDGACIFGADCENSRWAADAARCAKLGFGVNLDSDGVLHNWTAKGLESLIHASVGGMALNFVLPLTGRHNALNALAAILIAQQAGISPDASARTLRDFPGVARRLQRYPSKSGKLIFDDYAHNPGKILGCLQGLRSAFPDRRLIAVFQPHRYSRVATLYQEFVQSFACDNTVVIVVPVYAAGEPARPGFDSDQLGADIARGSGVKTFSAPSLKEAANLVNLMSDPQQDIIVTLGAGDVWQVAKLLCESN